jgi:protein-S-isoprenylcysteine O-methyltransferase Ste14
MMTSMSDQTSPDSTKLGSWLFRHRTSLPVPIAAAILLIPSGQTSRPLVEILSGVGLTVGGETIRLWGVHHIGVISRTRSDRLGPLVDTGPFACVRNPLYIGNILVWVGFAVTAGLLWLAPIVLILLAAEYHWIVAWEESLLKSRLGEPYGDYCRRVPRWLPSIRCLATAWHRHRGAVPGGSQAPTPARRRTLFSERGTLMAIAAGYLLLWLKARF